jgi:hypothetical protein
VCPRWVFVRGERRGRGRERGKGRGHYLYLTGQEVEIREKSGERGRGRERGHRIQDTGSLITNRWSLVARRFGRTAEALERRRGAERRGEDWIDIELVECVVSIKPASTS